MNNPDAVTPNTHGLQPTPEHRQDGTYMTTWTVTEPDGLTHVIEADVALAWGDGKLVLDANDETVAVFAAGSWASAVRTEGATPPPSPPEAHPGA